MELALLANLFVFLGTFAAGFKTAYDSALEDNAANDDGGYANTQSGTAGDDVVVATKDNTNFLLGAGDDALTASAGNDRGELGAGDDRANMGAGNDLAYGGDGADSIWGGMGSDTIFGDGGNDTLSGFIPHYGGDDTATAPDGKDALFGGTGNDVLILGRGDSATGGAGNDLFTLDTRWQDGSDQMLVQDFQRGSDVLNIVYHPKLNADGSPITPNLTITKTADGTGSVISIDGEKIATIAGVRNLVAGDVNLISSPVQDSGYQAARYGQEVLGTNAGEANSFTKGNALFAGGGNDTLTGSGSDDYADMGAGDDSAGLGLGEDSARGGDGADTLRGGAGNDTLSGNDGADRLEGEVGNDQLFGGKGGDLLYGWEDSDVLDGGDGADTLFGGAGNDRALGGEGDDKLAGNEGNDTLTAGDGADTLEGGTGFDSLSGDGGNDLVRGEAGADTLLGGDGADTLQGYGLNGENRDSAAQNDGADVLYGGAGNDVIWAGAGDRAYGDAGSDTFNIVENQFGATGLTRIEDFAAGEKIIIHYPASETAPVITLAPSPVPGEVNILADGEVIARVVDQAGALKLADISAQSF